MTFFYSTGDKYEVDWKSGKMNRKGTLYFLNGDVFTGLFTDGIKGKGCYEFDSNDVYEGNFNE